ncbi:MAG TPA: hypothetical protein VF791_16590 [Pyrinomonadaceae bacterium]
MISILSSISGQFSKSLILGTLLPVVTFLILGMVFVIPLFPYDWQFLKQLTVLDSQTIVVFTLVTVVLSGLLFSFHSAITRFYEGYTWSNTWVGQWRIRRYQIQLHEAESLIRRTLVLRSELRQRDSLKYRKLLAKIEHRRAVVGQKIINEFPISSSMLPTRLGNNVRSFYSYTSRQYNMEHETLWPRLRAKLDKEYAAAVEDAKTPLDFVINISFLSALLSLTILVVGLLYPIPLASRSAGVWWGIEILAFAFVAYVSYLSAINQARDWGNMLKSAVDLYRWDLLKQLGYKRVPVNRTEERALWGSITRQIIYGDPPRTRLADYVTANTFAYGYLNNEPFMVGLQVARGGGASDANGISTVAVRVKNEDGQKRLMKNVVVRDTLPDGFDYVWNSALISGEAATVSGSNPFYFEIRDLDYGEEKTLTYSMIQRKKS